LDYQIQLPRFSKGEAYANEFRLEQLDRLPPVGLPTNLDIIPLIGSESLVLEVMSKRQPLTLEMIRSIHHHLGIPADVLLQ
jgi:hypothetical protein